MPSSKRCGVLLARVWAVPVCIGTCLVPMPPHLTPADLDFLHAQNKKGQTPVSIHKMLHARRLKKHLEAPRLTNARRAFKGNTCKRSRKETRGRKKLYSRKMSFKMDTTRKQWTNKIANNS